MSPYVSDVTMSRSIIMQTFFSFYKNLYLGILFQEIKIWRRPMYGGVNGTVNGTVWTVVTNIICTYTLEVSDIAVQNLC